MIVEKPRGTINICGVVRAHLLANPSMLMWHTVMDDLGLDAGDVGSSSLFSGEEELFAFARAVSRLSQMG